MKIFNLLAALIRFKLGHSEYILIDLLFLFFRNSSRCFLYCLIWPATCLYQVLTTIFFNILLIIFTNNPLMLSSFTLRSRRASHHLLCSMLFDVTSKTWKLGQMSVIKTWMRPGLGDVYNFKSKVELGERIFKS